MMLAVQVLRAVCVYHATALNEVMVSKKLPFHIIQMRLASDGETVADFKGDGLILACQRYNRIFTLGRRTYH